MTIAEFCEEHDACAEARTWASGTGCTTMADLWPREDMRPEWREWIATRPGVLTDRELRLYACWCVRKVWHLLPDERSRTAVEVSERFARGTATAEELAAAAAAAAIPASPDSPAWAARSACATRASRAAQARYLLETVHPSFDARKAGV